MAGGTVVPWKSFTWTQGRNEPAQWELETLGLEDEWLPGASGNDYFNSSGSTSSTWTVTCYLPGEGTYSGAPDWLQSEYQFDGDATGNRVTVGGTDLSGALVRRNDEVMTDVETESSNDTLVEIFTEYGVTASNTAPDYEIQYMHRVGNPLDWIRHIFEVTQSWYYYTGSTMNIRQTTFPGSVDWALTDRHDLKLLAYRRSMAEVYNTVTVERTTPGDFGIVGRANKSGGDSLGIQEYTFPAPIYSARPTWKAKRGSLHTWVYKDADGDPISNQAPAAYGMLFSPGTPAASVVFTYENNPDATEFGPWTPEYDITWVGRTTEPNGETLEDYTATYSDPADVAIHGNLRFPRPILHPLINDTETAQLYAEAWVREAVRTYVSARVEILFEPRILPGQIVSITDYGAGLDGELFAVETVTHTGTEDSLTTTLELSRPASAE